MLPTENLPLKWRLHHQFLNWFYDTRVGNRVYHKLDWFTYQVVYHYSIEIQNRFNLSPGGKFHWYTCIWFRRLFGVED